ncbi:MAG: hypothetical protein D6741_12440, partial [Planctomycetota bacterium]
MLCSNCGESARAGSNQDVAKDDMDIVSAVLGVIADRVGEERFALWFGSRAHFSWRGDTLVVTSPNRFFTDWIRSRFGRVIDDACRTVLGKVPPIRFEVAADRSSVTHPVDTNDERERSVAASKVRAAKPAGRSASSCRPRVVET